MKFLPSTVALTAILFFAGTHPAAAQVAPKDAADIVTLKAIAAVHGFGSDTCLGGQQRFNVAVAPDGTRTAFDIPAGIVFIVTGYSAGFKAGINPTQVEGQVVSFVLSRGTEAADSLASATFGKNGIVAGGATLNPGIAVGPGQDVCMKVLGLDDALGLSVLGQTVQGYFFKSK